MSVLKNSTRRDFLTRGLGVVGAGTVLPNYLIRTALAAPQAKPDQKVLVVLRLSGGNDALSSLVPYGHEAYGKARTTTRIKGEEVIKLNNELGFHPKLSGFKELLDQGALAVIPGIGYPKTNYSHFTATEIWQTARYQAGQEPYGWIGRALDYGYKGNLDPTLSIAVGTGKSPRVMVGSEHPGIAFSQPESFRYTGGRGNKARMELYRKLNASNAGEGKGNLDFITSTAMRSNESSDRIRELAKAYKPKAEYPKGGLGKNLRIIASLITGGLATRVFFTETGGFDTHRIQREKHDGMMANLNDCVFAFNKDLSQQGQAHRVLTLTTSEFGRRVKENGSKGTDHGAGAAHFLAGSGVKPGIHGKHPSLTDLQGGGGGSLKHTTDFRSVYATLLEKWLTIPSEPVLGEKFPLVDLIA